jgi:hypothetical protein
VSEKPSLESPQKSVADEQLGLSVVSRRASPQFLREFAVMSSLEDGRYGRSFGRDAALHAPISDRDDRPPDQWSELIGGQVLRHVVTEFVAHYHRERIHQGLGGRLIKTEAAVSNDNGTGNGVTPRSRLGGLLNFHRRKGA